MIVMKSDGVLTRFVLNIRDYSRMIKSDPLIIVSVISGDVFQGMITSVTRVRPRSENRT